MQSYDHHANISYQHRWKLPEEQEEFVHFPAATYGIDANMTFKVRPILCSVISKFPLSVLTQFKVGSSDVFFKWNVQFLVVLFS